MISRFWIEVLTRSFLSSLFIVAFCRRFLSSLFYRRFFIVAFAFSMESVSVERSGSNCSVAWVDIEEAKSGGVSDPRNSSLIKMFNLISIGERAGSGIPSIYAAWQKLKFRMPEIVYDGGNVTSDGTNFSNEEELSKLTLSHKIQERLFEVIDGISVATAQCSYCSGTYGLLS